jgi:hypothetical protein
MSETVAFPVKINLKRRSDPVVGKVYSEPGVTVL